MTDAELTMRIKKILSSPSIQLPAVGARSRNEWGFEKETCSICGFLISLKNRRFHYAKMHGYSTPEWRVAQLVKLVRRESKQKASV